MPFLYDAFVGQASPLFSIHMTQARCLCYPSLLSFANECASSSCALDLWLESAKLAGSYASHRYNRRTLYTSR